MLAPQQKDALAESRRMLSEQVADLFRNHIPLVPKKIKLYTKPQTLNPIPLTPKP